MRSQENLQYLQARPVDDGAYKPCTRRHRETRDLAWLAHETPTHATEGIRSPAILGRTLEHGP